MISDFDIQALIDNELDREKEKTVRFYIENNTVSKKRYQKLIQQCEDLKLWASDKLKD